MESGRPRLSDAETDPLAAGVGQTVPIHVPGAPSHWFRAGGSLVPHPGAMAPSGQVGAGHIPAMPMMPMQQLAPPLVQLAPQRIAPPSGVAPCYQGIPTQPQHMLAPWPVGGANPHLPSPPPQSLMQHPLPPHSLPPHPQLYTPVAGLSHPPAMPGNALHFGADGILMEVPSSGVTAATHPSQIGPVSDAAALAALAGQGHDAAAEQPRVDAPGRAPGVPAVGGWDEVLVPDVSDPSASGPRECCASASAAEAGALCAHDQAFAASESHGYASTHGCSPSASLGGGGSGRGARKTEIPAMRLRRVYEFIQRTGQRPTRKSSDPHEKPLGIWLHRFTCNDDGVQDRARAALPEADFLMMLNAIERAPDAKQAYDRAAALKNLEAIAQRTIELGRVPLRSDPSGCACRYCALPRSSCMHSHARGALCDATSPRVHHRAPANPVVQGLSELLMRRASLCSQLRQEAAQHPTGPFEPGHARRSARHPPQNHR